jgi:Na+/proline symporter
MGIFNSKQTTEEILEKMDNCVDSQIHVGSVFLSYQLQKKLLEDQNMYNNKQLFWSRSLAIITAILTLATIALVFVTK